jgi:hypothetical protein
MIVYHGTTDRRARRISTEGFFPKKPSRRVWFAESRGYALRRAKVQARRSRDRPVVLTCDVNLDHLRGRLGARRIFHRNHVITIGARVPVTVLRSHPSAEVPSSPEELAAWVNHVLDVKPYKGVGRRHQGIERLSRWVANRLASQPRTKIQPSELLQLARQWLPEFFEGVEVDPEHLRVHRGVKTIEVEVKPALVEVDAREEEALDGLVASNPKRRIRGLKLLAEIEDPDLFDWCVMLLDDDSTDVRIAALHTMLCCDEGDAEVLVPFAESGDKRIRAAAMAALVKHSGEDAPRWFEWGLKDPYTCVRLETAAFLSRLDPAEHRSIFELALYDPNPQIVHLAQKLTAGKGYGKGRW